MNLTAEEAQVSKDLQDQKERSLAYTDRALRILRQHGCRITSPRTEVIKTLSEIKTPVSAYHLHELVKAKGGRADVVSIYRILDTLRGYGLVYHVGSLNAYFPVFIESANDRFAQLILHEDTSEIIELAIPSSILQSIEAQARALGIAVTSIKIELMARDIS